MAANLFERVDGTPASELVRFNANGTIDAAFQLNVGNVGPVYRTTLQSNGQILIAGYFPPYNGTTRNGLARLNPGGSPDAAFLPALDPNSGGDNLTVQPDGKILAAGYLLTNGNPTEVGLVRLLADGAIDNTFNAPAALMGGTIRSYFGDGIAVQPDGKSVMADFSGSGGQGGSPQRQRFGRCHVSNGYHSWL